MKYSERKIKMVESLENEVWKVIDDYPMYQVSNMGRVKRLQGRGCKTERLLRPCPNKLGYLVVGLCRKSYALHVLVAKAFCMSSWQPGYEVAHLNAIKGDCKADNLVWQSHQVNSDNRNKENLGRHKMPVRCIDTGIVYKSITEAALLNNVSESTLSGHLRGKTKTCAKLRWELMEAQK